MIFLCLLQNHSKSNRDRANQRSYLPPSTTLILLIHYSTEVMTQMGHDNMGSHFLREEGCSTSNLLKNIVWSSRIQEEAARKNLLPGILEQWIPFYLDPLCFLPIVFTWLVLPWIKIFPSTFWSQAWFNHSYEILKKDKMRTVIIPPSTWVMIFRA